ncbi:MAG: dienelactone hydrolase family protein [Sphingobium sp.]
MCDETTAANDDITLDHKGLTRREFAAIGTVAALSVYAPWSVAAEGKLTETSVEITTPDGKADAFFVHPAKGKHPGVLIWPDAIGLRDAKKAMARRLAAQGYAVLVVNPYYRDVRAPLGLDFSAFRTPEGRAKIMPYMAGLTPEKVTRDAVAYVAFLDAQAAVDTKRGIGVQGYCMGGALSFRTAAAVPARVKAVATFHGGGLVGDKPDSPYRLFAKTQASYLIAVAKDDDAKAPGDKDALAAAAKEAGRPAEIEVYGGDHGWCVPDAPAYNQVEAERAWARLLTLYKTL